MDVCELILYVVERLYALWPVHIAYTIQKNKQDTALDVVHFVLISIRRRVSIVWHTNFVCVFLSLSANLVRFIVVRFENSLSLSLTLVPASLSATSHTSLLTQYELFLSWIFIFICVFLRFSFILFSGHFLFGTAGCLVLISLLQRRTICAESKWIKIYSSTLDATE